MQNTLNKKHNHKGLFITFEGVDGAGKTTILTKVHEWLNKQLKNEVVVTREPGGKNNIIAEDIRNILLNHLDCKIDYRAEALLFAASRAQHVSDFILPNLKQGKIVLCDRYLHSSLVYQGYARKLGIQNVMKINEFAIQNVFPDLVIILMLTPTQSKKRIYQSRKEKLDRLDLENDLINKTYSGYKKMIAEAPKNLVVVDASKHIDEVFASVQKILIKFLKRNKYVITDC